MGRKCKICKSQFYGRSDKIFCSVKCKSHYHKLLNEHTDRAALQVDKVLHRNRSILLEIMGKHKTQKRIEKTILDRKKFNYSHITGYHINSKGKTVHHIYDFSYLIFSDQGVIIYRRKKEITF